MRNKLLLSFLLCPLAVIAAAPASTNQPTMIQIKSQAATFQFATNSLVFSGGVTVLDPDVLMTCQKLVASFAKKQKKQADDDSVKSVRLTSGEEVDKIEAIGHVEIKVLTKNHEGTIGKSERAIYTAADRKITMLGNRPTIRQPSGRKTTADTIIYFIETGVVDFDGDVEVEVERPAANLFSTSTQRK